MVYEEGDILEVTVKHPQMFRGGRIERTAEITKVDLPWIQVRFKDGYNEYYSFQPKNQALVTIVSHKRPPRLMKAVSRIPLLPVSIWRSGRNKR